MIFETIYKIRFGDIDQAQVVYYPRFFNYYHTALEDFFGNCHSQTYPDLIVKQKIGFPIVNIDANFYIPFSYGDTLRIQLAVIHIGNKSVKIKYNAFKNDLKDVAATAIITTAVIDLVRFKGIDIPKDLRVFLEKYRAESGF